MGMKGMTTVKMKKEVKHGEKERLNWVRSEVINRIQETEKDKRREREWKREMMR